MILRSTLASPFARKARIAIAVLGLGDRVEVRETDLNDPADTVRAQNPLGKVPVLLLEDGGAIYDSRVILDYLDHLTGGGRIVPKEARARFEALRLQALCDGILDAALLVVYESRYRPADMRVQSWIERQEGKIARGLATLEAEPPPPIDSPPHVGQIALACMLGYGDLRFGGAWRKDHPRLYAWLARFAAQVPAFEQTKAAS
jgi:glutathione S-transferase